MGKSDGSSPLILTFHFQICVEMLESEALEDLPTQTLSFPTKILEAWATRLTVLLCITALCFRDVCIVLQHDKAFLILDKEVTSPDVFRCAFSHAVRRSLSFAVPVHTTARVSGFG